MTPALCGNGRLNDRRRYPEAPKADNKFPANREINSEFRQPSRNVLENSNSFNQMQSRTRRNRDFPSPNREIKNLQRITITK
jgi:hypothetical protein